MSSVLSDDRGQTTLQAVTPGAEPQTQRAPAGHQGGPARDLQSRLAAIAKNIETLESKVAIGAHDPAPQTALPAEPQPDAPPLSPPVLNPLEALRRRKQELEQGFARAENPDAAPAAPPTSTPAAPPPSEAEPAPASAQPVDPHPAPPKPVSTASQDGLDQLVSRLDDQFARLTQAVGDVRALAETSAAGQAGLHRDVAALQSRLDGEPPRSGKQDHTQPVGGSNAGAEPNLSQLSDQIRAVQDAIAAMPKPEAIQSLEHGYRHVLARLESLKGLAHQDEKIDALYGEVSSLREVLDNLGENNASALVGEMRSMITRLERDPTAQGESLAEALESVKAMAKSTAEDPSHLNEAIGAVVERLVALEARIEALASGADDSAVTQRLDAIQSEMERLSTFQDEARGLTSALDTIREEMRSAAPAVDLAGIDQRFSALDRIEEMTGGYAAQVAELSERLNALDGRLANQADMAREVAALSRQMDAFSTTMPVREIEHALLDLTGRVTALQEDTGTARLGMAVRELGERVESCLRSIPKTETIISAVEAKIDNRLAATIDPLVTRLNGVDERLDGIQRAISAADAPLIDHMSNRLEGLIQAMPTPLADVALSSLESQLVELNKRHAEAGVVSRDDVNRLHAELARARASVELGSNRDLQRSIVDQVRHLASRFDTARSTNDAELLPEIERDIDDLAGRIRALGLFDPLAETQDSLGMQALQSELVALREHAGEQDQRMFDVLGRVQSALETVIGRIDALETGDGAARKITEQSGGAPAEVGQEPQGAKAPPPPTDDDQSSIGAATWMGTPASADSDASSELDAGEEETPLVLSRDEPDRSSSAPSNENPVDPVEMATPASASEEPGVIPAPGDAQTLLRQLSGAINAGANQPAARHGPATGSPSGSKAETDTQRASFIAAARRAAQAAALEAGGGSPAAPAVKSGTGQSGEPTANLAGTKPRKGAGPTAETARIEPDLAGTGLDLDAPQLEAEPGRKSLFGGAKKAARAKRAGKADKAEKGQRALSGAALIALTLFVVAAGMFVANLILSGDQASDTVIAPIAPVETPATGDGTDEADLSAVPNGRIPASDPDDVAATSSDTRTPSLPAADDRAGSDSSAAPLAGDTTARPVAPDDDRLPRDEVVGSGFERDRGPVMAETPHRETAAATVGTDDRASLAATPAGPSINGDPAAPDPAQADVAPPPANDLGPLLNLPTPSLPPATADALPEAIGSPRLRVAAASGDPAAAFEVATRYMEGRFVTQDLAAAAHWYGRAAELGIVPAAYRLGSFYEQGRGVDRDRDGAIAWYERAALGGNPRAMHNLAVMAAEGGEGSPNFSRAAGWFIPAANRGLADSQFNLAVLYARGMGVDRDLMESYKWFALAANAGDTEAVGRRDEVAGVLGEQALALARARVDNWRPVPIDTSAVSVEGPAGGWDDGAETASALPSQPLIAEAQALLAQRGYDPGPADGLLGPRTNEAVRAFRQSVGLGSSDAIDQALLDALRGGRSL